MNRSSDASVAEGEQDNNFHLRNQSEAMEQGQERVRIVRSQTLLAALREVEL